MRPEGNWPAQTRTQNKTALSLINRLPIIFYGILFFSKKFFAAHAKIMQRIYTK